MTDMAIQLIAERLTSIEANQREERTAASNSRGRMYEKMEALEKAQAATLGRVDKLESAITSMSPTVAEIVALKVQAQGAGKVGRALWSIGKWLIAAAAGAASMWAAFWAYFEWK